MSINKFKKMIMVSSFAVIAINVNAQDREEKDSFVSTVMRINESELRTFDDAQEDNSYSGLSKVVFDQLVTQPCQAALSTAVAFGKFSYQHPFTALAVTAAYALPVVAALLPESTTSWYPQFTCANTQDIQQIRTSTGNGFVYVNYAPAPSPYVFTPYTSGPGYTTATECSYRTWANWVYPVSAQWSFTASNCTGDYATSALYPYQWAQANYTWGWPAMPGPSITMTSWCVQAEVP